MDPYSQMMSAFLQGFLERDLAGSNCINCI